MSGMTAAPWPSEGGRGALDEVRVGVGGAVGRIDLQHGVETIVVRRAAEHSCGGRPRAWPGRARSRSAAQYRASRAPRGPGQDLRQGRSTATGCPGGGSTGPGGSARSMSGHGIAGSSSGGGGSRKTRPMIASATCVAPVSTWREAYGFGCLRPTRQTVAARVPGAGSSSYSTSSSAGTSESARDATAPERHDRAHLEAVPLQHRRARSPCARRQVSPSTTSRTRVLLYVRVRDDLDGPALIPRA